MFAEGNTRGNSPQYIGPITLEYFDVLLMKSWLSITTLHPLTLLKHLNMCDEQSTRIFGYVFLGPVEEPPESEIDHDGLRMELEAITTEVESQVTVKRLYEIIERECNYRVRLCKASPVDLDTHFPHLLTLT